MDRQTLHRLATDWVDRRIHALAWNSDLVLQRQDIHPETEAEFDNLCDNTPEDCWQLVLEILHMNHSDDVMLHLGLRLQLLIEKHPTDVIELVEAQASRDPLFKDLLGWLLPSEPNSELWSRVRLVAGDVPW